MVYIWKIQRGDYFIEYALRKGVRISDILNARETDVLGKNT